MEGFDNKRLMRDAELRPPKKMKTVCPIQGQLPAEVRGMALVTEKPAHGMPWKDNPGLEELTCPPCPHTQKDR